MAVATGLAPITEFEQWYSSYELDRDGCLETRGVGEVGHNMWRRFTDYKREMDARVGNYDLLEKLADGEVISPKDDLPNVSSGETSGLIRRIARSLVQNTPNVDIISKHDDDSLHGILARYVLTSKVIGSDEYANDMQQNLFASVKTSLTLGFAAVVPVLLQDAANGWYMKYDTIHYRDVFPEPGCKDVRDCTEVFVRRYLTKGEVLQLIRDEAVGWDVNALKTMLKSSPAVREQQSSSHQDKKRGMIPNGYEIITWYSSSGQPFLTFSGNTKMLLRIEKNKHPLKFHPVLFLVLEKDDQQPLGKSQVEPLMGRQDFQDLMLNGAMKLWYRNINPPIIGFGAVNAVPNLSPGKYTAISNPNAKVEPFEVNTGTLMQYGQISQQNLGSMVNLIGAPDQQMAQAAGNGMSATPQGVEAQAQVVDTTTNNYQKAVEAFFGRYCSYALTIFFEELKSVKGMVPTADARKRLLDAGLQPEHIDDKGRISVDFEEMAVEYWVRCVPGSLVEMEDEKQMRILNQIFVPLSQAMPALAASQDMEALKSASKAMTYIIRRQIELSGSSSAQALKQIWEGKADEVDARDARINELELRLAGLEQIANDDLDLQSGAIVQMQGQMSQMNQLLTTALEKLGMYSAAPSTTEGSPAPAPATIVA